MAQHRHRNKRGTSGNFENDVFVYGVYPVCAVEVGARFNVGLRFNAPVAPSNGYVQDIKIIQIRLFFDESCLTYLSTSRCVRRDRTAGRVRRMFVPHCAADRAVREHVARAAATACWGRSTTGGRM